MQIQLVPQLLDVVASGRIDAIDFSRHPTNPRILIISIRSRTKADQLWLDVSILENADDLLMLTENMMNTLIDQVSPG